LAELVERDDRLILGYRPNSQREFLLAPIHPPLVAFSGPSKPHQVNDSSQSKQETDHLVPHF
jgi:hypothetical protein